MNKQLQKELLNLELGIHFCETLFKANHYKRCENDMQLVYSGSSDSLARIVRKNGWPGESLVGEKGAKAAYVIARGAANNPVLMRSFLNALSEAVSKGEAKKVHEAGLMDLIRYYEGKPQLLGLFPDWQENGLLGAEVDDINRANNRRKALGLTTIQAASQEYLKKSERNVPPNNFRAYIQQLDKWASETGWRRAA